jgi:hypothetical protein
MDGWMDGSNEILKTRHKTKEKKRKEKQTYRTRNNRPIPLPNFQPPISIRIVMQHHRL